KKLRPGYVATMPYVDGESDSFPGWGWAAQILPFVEQDPLYRQIDFNQSLASSPAARTYLPVFICPSDPLDGDTFDVPDAFGNRVTTVAPCSYAACNGGDESDPTDLNGKGVFYRHSR